MSTMSKLGALMYRYFAGSEQSFYEEAEAQGVTAQDVLAVAAGNANRPALGVPVRPPLESPGNVALLPGRLYLCSYFDVDRACTLAEASLQVAVVGDGAAVIRLGIAPFAADGSPEGEALTAIGTINGLSATIQTITGIGLALAPGRYAVIAATTGHAATSPSVTGGNTQSDGQPGPVSLSEAFSNRACPVTDGGYSSLPATVPTFTTQHGSNSAHPWVVLGFTA